MLGKLVELRKFPLEVGVNEQASSCTRCSMLWDGGTSRADPTETSTLGSYTTTSKAVSSCNIKEWGRVSYILQFSCMVVCTVLMHPGAHDDTIFIDVIT